MLNPTLNNLHIWLETQADKIPGDSRRFRDAAPMLTTLADDLEDALAKIEEIEDEAERDIQDRDWKIANAVDSLRDLCKRSPDIAPDLEDIIQKLL